MLFMDSINTNATAQNSTKIWTFVNFWKFVNKLQLPAVFLQDLLHLVSSNALMFLQKRNRKTRKT